MALVCALLSADPGARCQQEPKPASINLILRRDLIAHAKHLASNEFKGRLTGSPAQAQAAKWISRYLEQLGLEPFGDTVEAGRTFDRKRPTEPLRLRAA